MTKMNGDAYLYRNKVVKLEELCEIIKQVKSKGKRVVFTNGCFDILHKGHIHYLRKSREIGDCLVIGLNADTSVKRLKGSTRPLNTENDRAFVLEALDFVDYIVIFSEDTPLNIIREIKPDIYTKSGDYSLKNIIGPGLGSEHVENYGGQVVIMDFIDGYSTTSIVNKSVKDNN